MRNGFKHLKKSHFKTHQQLKNVDMLQILFVLIFSLTFSPVLLAEPFWGSKASQPIDTPADKLKPGQFIWKGDAIPAGPTVAEVNLTEQRFYLYRNGVLIGLSTTSTGRGRRSTPTGIFSVLSKIRHHRSRKYNNAPMPYTQHINRTGIAMHAGYLPGYPASHGCIRLPSKFAQLLFKTSALGMPVVISRNKKTASDSSIFKPLSANESFNWQPEKSTSGAVSILISQADQRVFVYRNGIEIGRAKFTLSETALGSHAYLLHQGEGVEINPFLNPINPNAWVRVRLAKQKHQTVLQEDSLKNLNLPTEFIQALNSILKAGTSLYITDTSVLKHEISELALRALFGNQIQSNQEPELQVTTTHSKAPIAEAGVWPPKGTIVEMKQLKDDMNYIRNQIQKIKQELKSIENQL